VPSSSVYIGIDVACAVGKRLPICVVSTGRPLMPLMIPKHLAGLIPRGVGNKEITAAAPFQETARGVVSTINRIVGEMGCKHAARAALFGVLCVCESLLCLV
jgi:hypothetical protein